MKFNLHMGEIREVLWGAQAAASLGRLGAAFNSPTACKSSLNQDLWLLGLRFPEFPSLSLESSLPDRLKRAKGFVSSTGARSQRNQVFQVLHRLAGWAGCPNSVLPASPCDGGKAQLRFIVTESLMLEKTSKFTKPNH